MGTFLANYLFTWRDLRGMALVSGRESLAKTPWSMGRDPVEVASDSSSCSSWDGFSTDDEAPIFPFSERSQELKDLSTRNWEFEQEEASESTCRLDTRHVFPPPLRRTGGTRGYDPAE